MEENFSLLVYPVYKTHLKFGTIFEEKKCVLYPSIYGRRAFVWDGFEFRSSTHPLIRTQWIWILLNLLKRRVVSLNKTNYTVMSALLRRHYWAIISELARHTFKAIFI